MAATTDGARTTGTAATAITIASRFARDAGLATGELIRYRQGDRDAVIVRFWRSL